MASNSVNNSDTNSNTPSAHEESIGFQVAVDAFSSGQVGSKIWICEELEKIWSLKSTTGSKGQTETVWIYGGWQGVLGFLILCRDFSTGRVGSVRSFDIDPSCEKAANTICENWVWRQWMFRAFTADCNSLDPASDGEYGKSPTVVINTSVEHFDDRSWFEKIPSGTLVALQASDFEHDGAVSLYSTEEKFAAAFPFQETLFSGRLNFDYGTWSFNRLMRIGRR